MIYYYTNATQPAGIREFTVTGAANGTTSESYHNGTSVVAEPALLSSNGDMSLYTPLTAVVAAIPDSIPTIHVIYADNVISATSGYSRLSDISKLVNDTNWPTAKYGSSEGQVQLPLGIESADPHA